MSCNNKKLKYNCGTRTNARCVFYDLTLPDISKLSILEECLTIEETTEDIYKLLNVVVNSIDTSLLGQRCLTYPKVRNEYNPSKEDVYLVKDVLDVFEDKICDILETLEGEGEDTLDIDFKCLVPACGTPITSLKELLQVMIDEICKLKGE